MGISMLGYMFTKSSRSGSVRLIDGWGEREKVSD
jgi:hypothetical protein